MENEVSKVQVMPAVVDRQVSKTSARDSVVMVSGAATQAEAKHVPGASSVSDIDEMVLYWFAEYVAGRVGDETVVAELATMRVLAQFKERHAIDA